MKKSKKNSGGFVYSTNPDFQPESNEKHTESVGKEDMLLHLHREKKGRAGKAVVLIKGFQGSPGELLDLAKSLKAHCGTGGSIKGDEIIIQGDQRQKVHEFLLSKGYRCKLVGG